MESSRIHITELMPGSDSSSNLTGTIPVFDTARPESLICIERLSSLVNTGQLVHSVTAYEQFRCFSGPPYLVTC